MYPKTTTTIPCIAQLTDWIQIKVSATMPFFFNFWFPIGFFFDSSQNTQLITCQLQSEGSEHYATMSCILHHELTETRSFRLSRA